MKRLWVLLLVLTAAPAQAHFVFLVPGTGPDGKPLVEVVFSESPTPDNPELLAKVAHTEVFACSRDGMPEEVKLQAGKDSLSGKLKGSEPKLVGGFCRYGVIQRGNTEPFLLSYHAKTVIGTQDKAEIVKLLEPCGRLELDIVPQKGLRTVQVLWQGEPLAEAEVVFMAPQQEEIKGKTDARGMFKAAMTGKPGVYGLRARHVTKQAGELKGQKYAEVRTYATLTVRVGQADRAPASEVKAERKEDPGATRLLAEARAARAEWHDFPGFSGNLEVNINGKVARTPVTVSKDGKVTLQIKDEEASQFASRTLGSLVGHRLPSGVETATPCAFDDKVQHPLGRAITVLNDEFHSSYRIRDRQVIVVNRTMRDARFTITVMENKVNADKKFLPSCYVVNYWDLKGDVLKRSETHHNTWKRVGKLDLPASVMVVTATPTGLEARSLKLNNLKLLGASDK